MLLADVCAHKYEIKLEALYRCILYCCDLTERERENRGCKRNKVEVKIMKLQLDHTIGKWFLTLY